MNTCKDSVQNHVGTAGHLTNSNTRGAQFHYIDWRFLNVHLNSLIIHCIDVHPQKKEKTNCMRTTCCLNDLCHGNFLVSGSCNKTYIFIYQQSFYLSLLILSNGRKNNGFSHSWRTEEIHGQKTLYFTRCRKDKILMRWCFLCLCSVVHSMSMSMSQQIVRCQSKSSTQVCFTVMFLTVWFHTELLPIFLGQRG